MSISKEGMKAFEKYKESNTDKVDKLQSYVQEMVENYCNKTGKSPDKIPQWKMTEFAVKGAKMLRKEIKNEKKRT